MRKVLGTVLWSFWIVLASLPADAATCDSLRTLRLTNVIISSAQVVDRGRFVPPGAKPGDPALGLYRSLPAFCRVQGVIRPSSESHIEFEVWLRTSGWNGNYMGVGNGGAAGRIVYDGALVGTSTPGLAQALTDGFAAASTDTGHQGRGDDYSFGRRHPDVRIDYYYRAIHETAVAAKGVIRTGVRGRCSDPRSSNLGQGCLTSDWSRRRSAVASDSQCIARRGSIALR